jgi:DNA polymerase III alpha subunit (gram-positive type)
MKSPLKKIIVYDLETGGFSSTHNQITEIAMVVIDLETLTIIEEYSSLIKPRFDLRSREEQLIQEAKQLFKLLKIKDSETGLNILTYKGQQVTLKNLEPLLGDLELFYDFLALGDVLEYRDVEGLKQSKELKDIADLYFDKTYNPQALEVTHISRELMENEGKEYQTVFNDVQDIIKRNTIGNSKPILAGHNIRGFDNNFLELFFENNKADLYKVTNKSVMIDTLDWARLRWFEMPSYSLGVCANEVGLTLKEAHRALPDTVANAKFLIKMLQSLRGEGQQSSKYKRRKFNFDKF